ncbi:hypothetical protein C8N46_105334 [Kordia periserrulae]|uniref:SecDF P1 head subdomain domain-containing protein n=1 Tax=Kordia periserrulae TaxID=701523 RepID=A0A2T6BYX5_9FLAO|nr:hypothetical protein [Kordia periserrulae]PTX61177.1 hypothetical protein C8N46_105334 [Kordia periserrulae]
MIYKNHSIYSLVFALLLIIISCETAQKVPKTSIQFEIVENGLSQTEKKRGIENLKKRLETLGVQNVEITERQGQKVTFTYEGNIKRPTFDKAFSVAGKLGFYEVCLEKKTLIEYLGDLRKVASDSDTLAKTADTKEDVDALYGITFVHSRGPIFGVIPEENIKKIRPLLEKGAFYYAAQKKHIQFLLGKKDTKGNYDVYVVYTDKNGKSALDGSYVEAAAAEKSRYFDGYSVNIQMNEEGAKIWGKLTGHVYETRGNIAVVLDNIVYSAPGVVSGAITGGRAEIQGDFTKEEAAVLATAIRSGNIPKMEIISVTTLKPY